VQTVLAELLAGFLENHMFTFCALLILAIGVLFRLANLEGLVYWGDEVYSSLRILGYTTAQLGQAIAQGQPVAATVLQQFQQISPQLGVLEVLQGLLREDSHLTPLYFVLGRLWVMLFDSSAASIRGLSVGCSLLLFPSLYWLAMVLFQNRWVAACLVVLTAVSPMHLLFAQEARMYELWLLLCVVAQAALLMALRQNRWRDWGLFTIATIGYLYSHLLGAVLLVGNIFYLLVAYHGDRVRLQRFAMSVGVTIAALLPWLYFFINRRIVKTEDGTDASFNLIKALQNWTSLLRRLFADFNTTSSDSLVSAVWLMVILAGCLGLVVIAFHRLYRETPRSTWLFVAVLMLGLPIVLFPLSLRGILPSRYLLPSYVGMQLAISYLLGTRLSQTRRQWRGWSAIALTTLITLGLFSCGSIVRAEVWWHKGFSECNPSSARLINQTARPLVITDGTGAPFFDHALSNAISLSLSTKPETAFQVVLEPDLPDLELGEFSDRFVFTPSHHLRQWLEQRYHLEPLLRLQHSYRGSDVCLWRIQD
jgi:uncharacterized membrane protein